MTHRRPVRRFAIVPALLSAALLAGCGSGTTTAASDPPSAAAVETPSETPAPGGAAQGDPVEPAPARPGSYVDWATYDADRAAYAATDVVLFFHASWCPTCRATEESLDSAGVPDGLTIVKVDYDDATDLRQEYGVTVQHTFVHVEPDGNQLKRWTGTVTGQDIAAQIA